jgi:sec-independent protein translocase protein TatB
MFDIGWTEMLVIAIVMIVVVGPKDLPKMLRTFGRTTTKLRAMAGDFRKQFDEALKEAELDDVKGLVDDVRKLNPANEIKQALNPMQKAAADVRAGLDSALNPKPATPPVSTAASAAAAGGATAASTASATAAPDAAPSSAAAAAPGDFFPAAVDETPSPVAKATAPLKNGATHASAPPPAKPTEKAPLKTKAEPRLSPAAPKAAAAPKPAAPKAAAAPRKAAPGKSGSRSKPA